MKANIILNGDALDHLKELPEKSINMCMTSPPYWALRDYGIEVESIWDGEKDCEHEWQENIQAAKGGYSKDSIVGNNAKIKREPIKSNFCNKCAAWKGQLGLEPTFNLYIKHLCDIFDEIKRVLIDDGTCWVNLGDTYWGGGQGGNDYPGKQVVPSSGYGHKAKGKSYQSKSLVMIPFRFAIEMVNSGWILRNTIIWQKPNAMPSSVKDRFTVDFEYLFFFSKSKKYYFKTQYESLKTSSIKRLNQNIENQKGSSRGTDGLKGKRLVKAVATKISPYTTRPNSPHYRRDYSHDYQSYGKNKRTVWIINPKPFKEAHFAVYPEELCETPIKAGCPEEGIVLDPFFGAGTTGIVALKQNKKFIGIELNKEYIEIAKKRLKPHLEQTKLK